MAKTVYTVEQIELQGGQTVDLKPLNIFLLRKFQAELAKLQDSKSEEDTLNALLAMTKVCLTQALPELVEDNDAFEQAMDSETMYKIIEVCGGIKFNDPNLLAAAANLQE